MGMKWYDKVAYTLLIIGGLNWGILGFSELFTAKTINLVQNIFGFFWANPIYFVVGLAALYATFRAFYGFDD